MQISDIDKLDSYHPRFIVEANFHERMDNTKQAIDCYCKAIDLCANDSERKFLQHKLHCLKL